MVTIDNKSYTEYQGWFNDRMVSANKYGVPDVAEEMEEIESDIEKVPWGNLSPEERVSVANVAIRSIETIFNQAAFDGQIEQKKVNKIVTQFAMILFNAITLTEDPFDGAGLGLLMASVGDGV